MGQYAHTAPSKRGYISIDWMIMAVACIAGLFLIGTMLRTSVDPDETLQGDGFRQLSGDDVLLSFQDFSFEATGWTPAQRSDGLPGLGPVLGPFRTETVQRTFEIPADASMASVAFELHLMGTWTEGEAFNLSVEDDVILTISPDSSGGVNAQATESDDLQVVVRRTDVMLRGGQTSLLSAENDFISYQIGLQVLDPSEALEITLEATAAGGEARWTLDNLTAVAAVGDGSQTP